MKYELRVIGYQSSIMNYELSLVNYEFMFGQLGGIIPGSLWGHYGVITGLLRLITVESDHHLFHYHPLLGR